MSSNASLLRSNLVQRVLVGLPLAVVILWVCYSRSSTWVAGITLIALILCWREFLNLVLSGLGRIPHLFRIGGGLILVVLYYLGIYLPQYFIVGISLSVGILFLFNIRDYISALEVRNATAGSTLVPMAALPMGLVYILSLVLFVPKIHILPQGNVMLGCFLGGVWACDTGAYFAGRFLGRHVMAPAISPKKTWEGLLGGTVFTLAWLMFNKVFVWQALSAGDVLILAFVLAPLSQLGDLSESMLKRSVDKKDTSRLLLGHGGVLDRLDGYLISAPLFYLYVSLRFVGGVS